MGHSDNETEDDLRLVPRAIFGINGSVKYGLRVHPDKDHVLFPLGNKICVSSMKTQRQDFITGHSNYVSCLDVSRSGRYIASGQINHMGFRAYVILWDFATRKELARHDLHKVRVESICFTAADRYAISIGGKDDGTVIVFDIETYTPICRSVASKAICGVPLFVCALNDNSEYFLVSGERHLRIWSIVRHQKKLNVHDVALGKHVRCFTGVTMEKTDQCAYMGTMTGDIVKVVINCCDPVNVTKIGYTAAMLGAYGTHNPRKPYGKDCERYVNGVRNIAIVNGGRLLVGAGDGALELVEERTDVTVCQFKHYPSPTWPMLRVVKSGKVRGAITSLVSAKDNEFYVATDFNEIYLLEVNSFKLKLLKTCHSKNVRDIAFPRNLSAVFATAGYENIRIWSTKRMQELLRIMVSNFECASLAFTCDGTSIVSAWNDGIIRCFTPITGRLIYAIPNAHNKGCSALAISTNGRVLVTGGVEGQVRIWKIEPFRQSLVGVLKDHSGPVTSLDFNAYDTEVISASSDGSCVIWDVNRMTRKQVITANTQFTAARYFPTGVQLLTCGSDGRISYWMVYNGSLIRELEGSRNASVNCVSISNTGEYFVSAGSDQVVKVWDYKKGLIVATGYEHCTAVLSAKFSPCGKFFVTGSSDGCIIVWDLPEKYWSKGSPEQMFPAKKVQSKAELPASNKRENVDALISKTSKGDICWVECPPINPPKLKDVKSVPDIKKC